MFVPLTHWRFNLTRPPASLWISIDFTSPFFKAELTKNAPASLKVWNAASLAFGQLGNRFMVPL